MTGPGVAARDAVLRLLRASCPLLFGLPAGSTWLLWFVWYLELTRRTTAGVCLHPANGRGALGDDPFQADLTTGRGAWSVAATCWAGLRGTFPLLPGSGGPRCWAACQANRGELVTLPSGGGGRDWDAGGHGRSGVAAAGATERRQRLRTRHCHGELEPRWCQFGVAERRLALLRCISGGRWLYWRMPAAACSPWWERQLP